MSDPKCASSQSQGGQHMPGLWTRQVKWMNAKALCLCCIWGLLWAGRTVLTVPSPVPLSRISHGHQHCLLLPCVLRTGCWGCFWAKSCQHDLLSALVPLGPSAHLARGVLLTSLNKAGNGCRKCLLRVALILKCYKP